MPRQRPRKKVVLRRSIRRTASSRCCARSRDFRCASWRRGTDTGSNAWKNAAMLDLGTSFLASVARDPEALAIVDGDVRLSYSALPRFEPARALELIAVERITNLYLVPTLYHDLLHHSQFERTDLGTVRKLGFA